MAQNKKPRASGWNFVSSKILLAIALIFFSIAAFAIIVAVQFSSGIKGTQDIQSFGILVLLLALFYTLYILVQLQRRNHRQHKIIQQHSIAVNAIIEAEENELQFLNIKLEDDFGGLATASNSNHQLLNHQKYSNDCLNNFDYGLHFDHGLSTNKMYNTSYKAMPCVVMRNSLGYSLKNLIDNIGTEKIEVHFSMEGPDKDYDPNVKIILFRMFQECIENVLQHAKATKLHISLIQSDDYIDATIEDNGIGFNYAANKNGNGLKNIKARVGFYKGILDISSQKGKGTLIAFHIPLKHK